MKTLLLVGALLLSACGGVADDDSPARETAPFDDLTGTLDKAQEVEQQMQEQKERMDRAIQEAEQPPEARQ